MKDSIAQIIALIKLKENKMESENTQEVNEQVLVDAWEKTGLLEGAENKQQLAYVLELCGRALVQVAEKMPQEQAGYIAMTSFAVLVRALRSLQFTTNIFDTDTVETVFINAVLTPEEQLKECVRAGEELTAKLKKYENLNLSKIRISNFDNGYHIGLDCN